MPTLSFRGLDMYIDDKPVDAPMRLPDFIYKGFCILIPLFLVYVGFVGALGATSGALINMALETLGYRVRFVAYGFAAGVSVGVLGCLVAMTVLALTLLYVVIHGVGKDGKISPKEE